MIKKIIALSALSILAGSAIAADAANNWKKTTSVSALGGNYYQAYVRNTYHGGGIKFSGNYLNKYGFSVGVKNSLITYNLGYNDIEQNSLFLSGRYNFFSDEVKGTIVTKVDAYYIDNDDVTGNSDKVSAIAPQVAYMPYSGVYSLNLGTAYTNYQNNLSVTQITPGFGLAFNNKMGWLSLGAYFIKPDNPNRAMGIDSTEAVEVSVTHWLKKGEFLPINFLTASLMLGERIYAVDNTSNSVYNVLDIQEGSVSVGCSWDIGSKFSLLSVLGHEKFRDINFNDEYSSNYIYLSLSKKW
ncbi:MAG: hypothetical protein D6B28_08755 [Gammaproteobacteria bacterium]|nr:MAG: hypothetical protein D6B28_08755 [Gammaproteobacteria bacterium]